MIQRKWKEEMYYTNCCSKENSLSIIVYDVRNDAFYKGTVHGMDKPKMLEEMSVMDYFKVFMEELNKKKEFEYDVKVEDQKLVLVHKEEGFVFDRIGLQKCVQQEKSALMVHILENAAASIQRIEEERDALMEENRVLKNEMDLMGNKMDTAMERKQEYENQVYAKVIALVNSKKDKIKQLQSGCTAKTLQPESIKHCSAEDVLADRDE